jgi:hypothetical protein
MARKHEFKAFDAVELSEWVGDVPVGSRGGLLEFPDPDLAMVEITEPPLGAVDRILFVPVSRLRLAG